MHLAVNRGDVEITEILLAAGADVEAEIKNIADRGSRPLHLAVQEDDLDVVTMLLQDGANVNSSNAAFQTSLHLAIGHCNLAMVQILL